MSDAKIRKTKNYAMFTRSAENRPTCLEKHKKLRASLDKYGFLKSFPVVCVRRADGVLVVKDGQHRLQIAAELSLDVYWVEETVDFDVAVINCTAKGWTLYDFAAKHAMNGKADYQAGLDFAKEHGIPLGKAFALLAGTTTFSNCQDAFVGGAFEIKDRLWADAVASLYMPMIRLCPAIGKAEFLDACMAVCRVESFDGKRLISKANQKPEFLVNYGTRDGYLEMLERIYNFNVKSQSTFPLKLEANKAMKARFPIKKKKQQPPA